MSSLDILTEKLLVEFEDGKPLGLIMAQEIRPREYEGTFGCLSPVGNAILGAILGYFAADLPGASLFGLMGAIFGIENGPLLADAVIGHKVRKEEKKYFETVEIYLEHVDQYTTTGVLPDDLPNYLQDAIMIDSIPYLVYSGDVEKVEETILKVRTAGYAVYPARNIYRASAYRMLTNSLIKFEKNIVGSKFLGLYDPDQSKDDDEHLLMKSANTLIKLVEKNNPLVAKALNSVLVS